MNVLKTAFHTAVMDLGTGHGFLLCPPPAFESHLCETLGPSEPGLENRQPPTSEILHSDRQEVAKRLAEVGWRICPVDDEMEIDGRALLVLYTSNPSNVDPSLDAFVNADAELRRMIGQEIMRGHVASSLRR